MLPIYLISTIIIASIIAIPGYIYLNNPELIEGFLTAKKTSTNNDIPATKTNAPKIAVQTTTQQTDPTNSTQDILSYEQNVLTPSFLFLTLLDDQLVIENNKIKLAAIRAARPIEKKVTKKKRVKTKKKVKKQKPKTKPKPIAKVKPKKMTPPKVKPIQKSSAPVKTKVTVLGDNSQFKQKKISTESVAVGHKKTSKSQLNSVIRRFKKSRKPALGLFISNEFYKQGNYKESYNYAKQTYKINPKLEDAVILYAKSLAKLGKSDIAISKLQSYIKSSGSIKARTVLNQIKKGTL